jgi:hypothetical protein
MILHMAIDHGPSFDAWLRQWRIPMAERVSAKTAILGHGVDFPVAGLVVGSDLRGTPGLKCVPDTVEVWIGLEDRVVETWPRHLELANVVTEMCDETEAAGIKVAFDFAAAADLDPLFEVLDFFRSHTAARFILEPYFAATLSARERRDRLDALSEAGDDVAALKLGLVAPREELDLYAQRITVPWFIRSSGASFDEFLNQLSIAARYGCSGCIAGTALWGVEDHSPLDDRGGAFAAEFRERMRRVVDGTSL